jgi:hypothetical protein
MDLLSDLQVLGRFHFWDYHCPQDLPPQTLHSFQVVIIDPPYLVRPHSQPL